MLNSICFKSKFGWISAKEENNIIISIFFGKSKNQGSSMVLKKLKKNLKNYFLGKKNVVFANIYFNGSKLQINIWKELVKIPYGKTKSYGEIAKIVNTSPRYVWNVCVQNKHLLDIPCHRVIRGDGSLGGFSGLGGLTLKRRLLRFENLKIWKY